MAFNAIRRVWETLGEAASGKASSVAQEKPLDKESAVDAAAPHFAEMYRSIDAAFTEPKPDSVSFMAMRAKRDAGWNSRAERESVMAASAASKVLRARPSDAELRLMSAPPYRAIADDKVVAPPATKAAALFDAARKAMRESHSPYSQFPVGAAILSESGDIHAGCNIENASFPEGWCAETSAIAHMVMAGDRRIVEIAVIAEKMPKITPCGGCRQRILEFASADTRIHLCDDSGVVETLTLDDILPRVF